MYLFEFANIIIRGDPQASPDCKRTQDTQGQGPCWAGGPCRAGGAGLPAPALPSAGALWLVFPRCLLALWINRPKSHCRGVLCLLQNCCEDSFNFPYRIHMASVRHDSVRGETLSQSQKRRFTLPAERVPLGSAIRGPGLRKAPGRSNYRCSPAQAGFFLTVKLNDCSCVFSQQATSHPPGLLP